MNPVRIVIVDDDPHIRAMATTFLDVELDPIEHDLRQVEGGVQALICCAHNDVDVLVLDMNMPEVDGLTVLRHLNSLPTRPCVVAWSADPFALRTAATFGADVTVEKGGDVLALADAVRQCVEARAATAG